jgi:photosystem II stability/assembly factor-like uncharacterized protein
MYEVRGSLLTRFKLLVWGITALLLFGIMAFAASFKRRLDVYPNEIAPGRKITLQRVGSLPGQISSCTPISIQFINERIGWLQCDGKIWLTTSGGDVWHEQYVDASPVGGMSFFFQNEQTGGIATSEAIRRTDDGGYTWRRLAGLTATQKCDIVSNIVFLPDGKAGWLSCAIVLPFSPEKRAAIRNRDWAGAGQAYTGSILFTQDGGESWTLELQGQPGTETSKVFAEGDGPPLVQTEFGIYIRQNRGWKKLERSNRGGRDRTISSILVGTPFSSDSFGLRAVVFSDSLHGYMSFSQGFLAGTDDGGTTWCDIAGPGAFGSQDGFPVELTRLFFSSGPVGWGLGSDGQLRQTRDGGVHWDAVQPEIKFYTLFFLDAAHGWAVSDDGVFRITS